jgi:hypothetical protein
MFHVSDGQNIKKADSSSVLQQYAAFDERYQLSRHVTPMVRCKWGDGVFIFSRKISFVIPNEKNLHTPSNLCYSSPPVTKREQKNSSARDGASGTRRFLVGRRDSRMEGSLTRNSR